MTILGTCHCKATRFEVDTLPESVTSCTCTFCAKRGALWVYYAEDQVRILSETSPGVYAPGGLNQHHFCATCGCGTFSVTPDWSTGEPDMSRSRVGLSARLFDDIDLKMIPHNEVDGRNLW